MYRLAVLCIALFSIWLAWSGHYTAMLVGLGLGSCALVLYLCQRMDIVDAEGHLLHLIGGLASYLPWLACALLRANLDVARRILSPSLPIAPRLIRIKPSQKTHLGQVVYANSITLTPGTVSIEVEEGVIEVHALSRAAARDLLAGEMDRRVTSLEGGS